MNSDVIERTETCPICKNQFKTLRVKKSAIRIIKRDIDFCNHYKSENPYFYSVLLCPKCGYMNFESKFHSILKYEKAQVLKTITPKWQGKSYEGYRTLEDAIEIYKLLLFQFTALKRRTSYIAGVCLKLAWFYRYKGNEKEETKFLRFALDGYAKAYSTEDFPISGMASPQLEFLVGELYRKFGDYQTSIKWFNKVVHNPESKNMIHIKNKARDQWQLAAEEYRSLKGKELILEEDV